MTTNRQAIILAHLTRIVDVVEQLDLPDDCSLIVNPVGVLAPYLSLFPRTIEAFDQVVGQVDDPAPSASQWDYDVTGRFCGVDVHIYLPNNDDGQLRRQAAERHPRLFPATSEAVTS